MRTTKRFLALFLAFLMAFGSFPTAIVAAEGEPEQVTVEQTEQQAETAPAPTAVPAAEPTAEPAAAPAAEPAPAQQPEAPAEPAPEAQPPVEAPTPGQDEYVNEYPSTPSAFTVTWKMTVDGGVQPDIQDQFAPGALLTPPEEAAQYEAQGYELTYYLDEYRTQKVDFDVDYIYVSADMTVWVDAVLPVPTEAPAPVEQAAPAETEAVEQSAQESEPQVEASAMGLDAGIMPMAANQKAMIVPFDWSGNLSSTVNSAGSYTWSTSNANVVKITGATNGKSASLQAISAGTAIVSVTAKQEVFLLGERTTVDTWQITVSPDTDHASNPNNMVRIYVYLQVDGDGASAYTDRYNDQNWLTVGYFLVPPSAVNYDDVKNLDITWYGGDRFYNQYSEAVKGYFNESTLVRYPGNADLSIDFSNVTWTDLKACFNATQYTAEDSGHAWHLNGKMTIKKQVTVTVNYVYGDGPQKDQQAAEPFNQKYNAGQSYTVDSPAIEGYVAVPASVSGLATTDVNKTVFYYQDKNKDGIPDKDQTASGSVTMEGWTYGDTPSEPVASITGAGANKYVTPPIITYYVNSEWVSEKPTDVGNYQVKAVWESAGLPSVEAVGSFTVAKRAITVHVKHDGELYVDDDGSSVAVTVESTDNLVDGHNLALAEGTTVEVDTAYVGDKDITGGLSIADVTITDGDGINVTDNYTVTFTGTAKVKDKYTVSYDWGEPYPAGEELPQDPDKYKPGEEYSVDETYYKDMKVVTREDTYNNPLEEYVFSGWNDPNNGVMGTSNVTITGTWTKHEIPESQYQHKVTYSWTDEPTEEYGEQELPVLPAEKTYVTNQKYTVDTKYTASSTYNKLDEYGNVVGTWTFDGWKLGDQPVSGEQTMGEKDVQYTGHWTYTPAEESTYKHSVTYKWEGLEDATTSPDLPAAETYARGASYTVDTDYTAGMTFDDNGSGLYTFSGWSESGEHKMGDEDVIITGTWTKLEAPTMEELEGRFFARVECVGFGANTDTAEDAHNHNNENENYKYLLTKENTTVGELKYDTARDQYYVELKVDTDSILAQYNKDVNQQHKKVGFPNSVKVYYYSANDVAGKNAAAGWYDSNDCAQKTSWTLTARCKMRVTFKDGANGEVFKDQQYYPFSGQTDDLLKTWFNTCAEDEKAAADESGNPKRNGYVFTGWQKSTASTTSYVTFTAQWKVDTDGDGTADEDETNTITVEVIGGTASAEGFKIVDGKISGIPFGADVNLTFTPDVGYAFFGATVDGVAVEMDSDIYTFSKVTANHTIVVEYKPVTLSVEGGEFEYEFKAFGVKTTLNDTTNAVTLEYSTDGGASWSDEAPTVFHVTDGTKSVTVRAKDALNHVVATAGPVDISVYPHEVTLKSNDVEQPYTANPTGVASSFPLRDDEGNDVFYELKPYKGTGGIISSTAEGRTEAGFYKDAMTFVVSWRGPQSGGRPGIYATDYKVNYVFGDLIILKRVVTVKKSAIVEAGQTYTYTETGTTTSYNHNRELYKNETLTVTIDTTGLEPGVYTFTPDNPALKANVVKADGTTDSTNNYNLNLTFTITVVGMKAEDVTWEYDYTTHAPEVELLAGDADTAGLTVQYRTGDGEWSDDPIGIMHVAEGPKAVYVQAVDAEGNVVCEPQDVVLTVTPHKVTLRSATEQFYYTPYAHSSPSMERGFGNEQFYEIGSSPYNHVTSFPTTSSVTDVAEGEVENVFYVSLINNRNIDPQDYEVTEEYGKLSVLPRQVSVKQSLTVPYTGETQSLVVDITGTATGKGDPSKPSGVAKDIYARETLSATLSALQPGTYMVKGVDNEAVVTGDGAEFSYKVLKEDRETDSTGNYDVTFDLTLIIEPVDVQKLTVEPPTDLVYDATAKEPVVKDGDKVLVEGVDYEISYSGDNVNYTGQNVTATITGKGGYTGTVTVSYKIDRRYIGYMSTITKVYNGQEQKASFDFSNMTYDDGSPLKHYYELVEGHHFTYVNGDTFCATGTRVNDYIKGRSTNWQNGKEFRIESTDGTNVSNNYYFVSQTTLTITQAPLTLQAVDNSKVYGTADPELTYKVVNGTIYQRDIDRKSFLITVSRADGEDVGSYGMRVGYTYPQVLSEDGKNRKIYERNYDVTVLPGTFTITAADMSEESGIIVSDAPTGDMYDANEHKWTPEVTDGVKTLTENEDYTVQYYRNGEVTNDFVSAGKIDVVIEGKGNYSGTIAKSYTIALRPVTLYYSNADNHYTYDGTEQKLVADVAGTAAVEEMYYNQKCLPLAEGDYVSWVNTDKVFMTGTNYMIGNSKSWMAGPGLYFAYGDETSKEPFYVATILNKDKEDVTANYTGQFLMRLWIDQRPVTLTSANDSKEYDGTPLTNDTVTVTGDFVEGEGVTWNVTGSQTLVGYSKNTFTYEANEGTDLGNYSIKKVEGTLTVTNRTNKYEITVQANSDEVTYDGKNHEVEGFKSLSFDVEGNTYTVEGLSASASGKDAGTYDSKVTGTAVVKDAAGNDVTAQFTVKTEDGKLTINKKAATVTSASAEKEYDGKALTAPEVTGEGFVEGEGVTGTATGSQTLVGSSENEFTYEAKEGTNLDNYTITETKGTLTVKDRTEKYEITVQAKSDEVTYDGAEHSVSGFESLTFEVEGNTYTVEGLSASASGTDADEYPSNVTGTAVVKDAEGNDVTAQFTVKTEDGKLTITAKPVVDPDDPANSVTVRKPGDVKYNGESQQEKPVITDGDTPLVEGKDYELKYTEDTTNAGTVTVTVEFEGNYAGTESVTYEITPRTVTMTSGSNTWTYNGEPHSQPTVTESGDGFVTGQGAEYSGFASITGQGTVANTFTHTLKEGTLARNYTIAAHVNGTLTVTPAPAAAMAVNAPANFLYDGAAHQWAPTVTGVGGAALTAGTDYTVTYSTADFTNVTGAITVTITGIGNYSGAVTRTYQITPRPVTLTSGSGAKVYDGTPLTNGTMTVGGSGFAPGEGAAYTFTGSQTAVGTSPNSFTYALTGGAQARNYTITTIPGTLTVTPAGAAAMTVNAPGGFLYDGAAHQWIPTVTGVGGAALTEGTDYTVTYSTADFTDAGTITATITGIGNYSGTVTRTYQITPRTVVLTAAGATRVYNGAALTNGTVTVGGNGFAPGEGAAYNVTGSQTNAGSSANTFTYTLNGNTNAANYRITALTGTLTVTPAALAANTPGGFLYDGTAHRWAPTVTGVGGQTLTAGTDYTVTYSTANVTDAGTVTATVTGQGNYAGTLTRTYQITPRTVVLVSASATKTFDGTALRAQNVTVGGNGFARGEGATYNVTGRQTAAGTSANTFTYTLNANTDADNYRITTINGTLTVTAAAPADDEGGNEPGPAGGVVDIPEDETPLGETPEETPEESPEPTDEAVPADDEDQGPDYLLSEEVVIDDNDTPLGSGPAFIEQECCILHFVLMLCALAVAVYYTHDRKKRQAREFELRSEL